MRAVKPFVPVLLAVILSLFFFCTALGDVIPIPMDMREHGVPPKAEGWVVPDREYRDESIHVVLEEQKNYKAETSKGDITIHWAVIEIKDPSQLRTCLSYDSFDEKKAASTQEMIAYLNPVAACNDDYAKINNFAGYVVRQGVLCLDNLDEWPEELKQDVLLIDDRGDFHAVRQASSADVQAETAELESNGRKAVNAFTFGPALIIDGEVQEITGETSARQLSHATARTVICQLDTLKYAVFAANSPKNGYGIDCRELAEFIAGVYPECRVAYNLDGGGSSRLYIGQKRINLANGRREIYGMIYFASAASDD